MQTLIRSVAWRLVFTFAWFVACGCDQAVDPGSMIERVDSGAKGDAPPRGVDLEPGNNTVGEPGQKWAVVVGVNRYFDRTISSLRFAVADAELIADTLAQKCGYPKDNVLVMTDKQPDILRPQRINLIQEIPEWLAKVGSNDTVFFFFSGHGFVDEEGQTYLAPNDCQRKNLALYGLRVDMVANWLKRCKAQRKLLVLDCCHAGGKGSDVEGSSSEKVGQIFETAKGIITLASCKREERSYEWPDKEQGVFTYFLVQGLTGEADVDRDTIVDSDELFKYLWKNVRKQARNMTVVQTPVRFIPPETEGIFELARQSAPPTFSHRPVAPPEELTLSFTVREGSRYGPLADGAEVQLLHISADGGAEVQLGKGKTDTNGHVVIDVPGSTRKLNDGKFEASIAFGGKTTQATLGGFPGTNSFSLFGPVRSPEKLMRVTLETEDNELQVVPLLSLGADIVNYGGMSNYHDGSNGSNSVSFDYLPGAVVCIGTDALLTLPEDYDGKTLNLEWDEHVLYADSVPVFVNFDTLTSHPKQVQSRIDGSDDSEEKARLRDELTEWRRRIDRASKRFDSHVSRIDPDNLGVVVGADSLLNLVERTTLLLNSGAGVYFIGNTIENPKQAPQLLLQAIRSIRPRYLLIDSRNYSAMEGDLPSIESLALYIHEGDRVPDLSSIKRLRHLYLAGRRLDLHSIGNLDQLLSLKVIQESENSRLDNIGAIGQLSNLQFLVIEKTLSDSVLRGLPRLQHLVAPFPTKTDFGFTKYTPYLRTLGITNMTPKHDLGPLENIPKLRCLALSPLSENDEDGNPVEFSNVTDFRREHRDVKVVTYRGFCLGSLWLPSILIAAALLAMAIRRHRHGNRQSTSS